jgi:putative FmdB family regulatory protein
MPIYEYRCAACGHELEALQKLADSPLKDCPSCGQSQLSKLMSAAGFRLKGSGWYATDFKGGRKGVEKSNGESGKGESGKGESGKGESGKGDAGKGEGGKSESKSGPAVATSDGAGAKPAASEAKPASKPATDATS